MTSNDEFDETELQALHDAVAKLPREMTPKAEAWSAIRDRIEASRVHELMPEKTRPARNNTRWVMLAAAVLFVTVTTTVVLRENRNEVATPAHVVAEGADGSMLPVFARYDAAVLDLNRDLEARRTRMDPTTTAVIDSCLSTIDRAIQESRTALASTPANATIAELLEVTYQQKLDLLRRATELPLGSF